MADDLPRYLADRFAAVEHTSSGGDSMGSDVGKPLYYEHLGGYGMHEMKDYNRHSPIGDVTVRRSQSAATSGQGFDVGGWSASSRQRTPTELPSNSRQTGRTTTTVDNETIYVTSI